LIIGSLLVIIGSLLVSLCIAGLHDLGHVHICMDASLVMLQSEQ